NGLGVFRLRSFAILGVNELEYVTAQQVVYRELQDSLLLRADEPDTALRIDQSDNLRNAQHQQPQFLFVGCDGCFNSLPFHDVTIDAENCFPAPVVDQGKAHEKGDFLSGPGEIRSFNAPGGSYKIGVVGDFVSQIPHLLPHQFAARIAVDLNSPLVGVEDAKRSRIKDQDHVVDRVHQG